MDLLITQALGHHGIGVQVVGETTSITVYCSGRLAIEKISLRCKRDSLGDYLAWVIGKGWICLDFFYLEHWRTLLKCTKS